jgi:voltage-gated potassium channel Kch
MVKHEYRWRHLALLICILLLTAVTPFVESYEHGILVLNVIAAALLVAGSYALSERRRLFVAAIVLSLVSVVATALLVLFPGHWTVLAAHSAVIILITFFAIAILGYVLRRGRITSDRIFAAICVYLLIGFAWSFGYSLLEELMPGSFGSMPSIQASHYEARVMRLRYFSFMTLTTVGYGDVTPRTQAAQTMALFEAVMGQIYLTVLIARLVGLHIAHAELQRGDNS